MAIPLRQALAVGLYVLKHRFKGTPRFPLVLMLEPLFRCNLACAGCGKIQYPTDVLRRHLSVEECLGAADECGAPVVSIAGGEPLMHPEITEIVEGLARRRKFVYLCTNALLLEKHLPRFRPSPYLTLSVHVDGTEARHDEVVCREGVFRTAIAAIRAAKARRFRVTTNTTIFEGEDPEHVRQMFRELTEVGVDGMMISPGYSYEKAPDQAHFLRRGRVTEMFARILAGREQWALNHSQQFLDFLEGKRQYLCTPWGNPTRNLFGWQRPCYLFADGYARTFRELLETTDWSRYGTGRHEKCADCMVHSGYEASAVLDATDGVARLVAGARKLLGGSAPEPVPVHWRAPAPAGVA
ncbi:MAG: adenosyl-hopene transferase HpnH [Planctomycetales bacterium]|nr:adenosyl-hopene transferase HpnH [Planctomycetales bacterium]